MSSQEVQPEEQNCALRIRGARFESNGGGPTGQPPAPALWLGDVRDVSSGTRPRPKRPARTAKAQPSRDDDREVLSLGGASWWGKPPTASARRFGNSRS